MSVPAPSDIPPSATTVDPDVPATVGTPAPQPLEPEFETRRRRWPRVVAVLAFVSIGLLVGGFFYGQWAWGRVEKVEIASLGGPSGSGTNYLIVGTDSREGLEPDTTNSEVIFGEGAAGMRSDTVVVLHVGDQSAMMAIPRDLLVTVPATGEEGRINAALRSGPDALVETVESTLGLSIDHYMEVDFAGFLDLVDAVGGVDIEFPYPASDEKSGLLIAEAGVHRLNSDEALAYVRSRSYTESRDGSEVVDGSADLGRVERQQAFLRSLFGRMGRARNPLTLNKMLLALGENVVVDSSMSFFDALGMARKLSGLSPETLVLPTTPHTTTGGAAVLLLNEDEADPILGRFR